MFAEYDEDLGVYVMHHGYEDYDDDEPEYFYSWELDDEWI